MQRARPERPWERETTRRQPERPAAKQQEREAMSIATVALGRTRRRGAGIVARARRAWQVTSAFTWFGYTEEVAYPLNFALKQAYPVFSVIVYYFLSKLVGSGDEVANDYYSFLIIGAVVVRLLDSGLGSFSQTLEATVNQGRLETLLVEPIRWKLIPFGLASWGVLTALVTAALMVVVAMPLGLHVEPAQMPAALLIIVLGIGASHALGIVAAAIKLISKRGNPFVMLYGVAVTLLCGVMFPVSSLPGWLQPLSYTLPPTYVIQGLRRTLLPDGDLLAGPSTLTSVLALAAMCLFVYPLSLWLYGRTVDVGRRYGTLAGY
jgi:ABC-2 type transport system permease protein